MLCRYNFFKLCFIFYLISIEKYLSHIRVLISFPQIWCTKAIELSAQLGLFHLHSVPLSFSTVGTTMLCIAGYGTRYRTVPTAYVGIVCTVPVRCLEYIDFPYPTRNSLADLFSHPFTPLEVFLPICLVPTVLRY